MQADGLGPGPLGSGPLGSLGAAMPKVAEAMRRVAVNVKRMVADMYVLVAFGVRVVLLGSRCADSGQQELRDRIKTLEGLLSSRPIPSAWSFPSR